MYESNPVSSHPGPFVANRDTRVQRAFSKLVRFMASYAAYASSVLQSSGKDPQPFRPTWVATLDNDILSMLPISNNTPVRVKAKPPKCGGRSRGQTTHSGKVVANTAGTKSRFTSRGRNKNARISARHQREYDGRGRGRPSC